MIKKAARTLLTLLPLAALQVGCSNDSILGSGDLVTVSGFVNNIDTLFPAADVKVYLYNFENEYNTTTASDGSFSLKVPVGTRFILVTDDEDGASKDNWFKTANFEIYKPEVDEGFSNYFIHACPTIASDFGVNSIIETTNFVGFDTATQTRAVEKTSEKGSVAVWKEFLANTDASDTYFPDVNKVSDASGIVSMVIWQYSPTTGYLASAPKIQVTSNSEDDFGPIVYTNGLEFFKADADNMDADLCDAFLPGKIAVADAEDATVGIICNGGDSPDCSKTQTNEYSLVWSFGKPTFEKKSVTLSFKNKDTSGDREITNMPDDLEVFVEPNMISLILWTILDENDDGNYEGVPLGESLGPIFDYLATQPCNS